MSSKEKKGRRQSLLFIYYNFQDSSMAAVGPCYTTVSSVYLHYFAKTLSTYMGMKATAHLEGRNFQIVQPLQYRGRKMKDVGTS